MPFIDSGRLKAELATTLKVTTDTLGQAEWDEIIDSSVKDARNEIVGALVTRGYTLAQILTWDRIEEFQCDIGLFWALVKGAGLHGNDPTFIDKLDRRGELATVALLVDDVPIDLDDDATGEVGYGTLDTTDDTYTADTAW